MYSQLRKIRFLEVILVTIEIALVSLFSALVRYLRIWTLHFSQLDLGIFSIFSSIGIVNFEHISPRFFFFRKVLEITLEFSIKN